MIISYDKKWVWIKKQSLWVHIFCWLKIYWIMFIHDLASLIQMLKHFDTHHPIKFYVCRSHRKQSRVCKHLAGKIFSVTKLTRTLTKRFSSSSRSGIGGFVRFLVDGCRTWWLFTDAAGPSNIVCSLDVIKPILH